jgi:DNA polymerase III subunit beta
MNFTTSKKELFEALQKVIGVVPQKTTIAILTCILMDMKKNVLQLTGTDLEISITTDLKVKGEKDGCVAIPGKILMEIVRELPDVPINMILDKENKIILRTDKGEYKLTTQPKEDFPKINIEEEEYSFQMEKKVIARMAEKTVFAVSNDELRPALTGINMELNAGEIKFVATDGHRLAKITCSEKKIAKDVKRSLIIPTKTTNLLLRNLHEEGEVKIQIGEDHIVIGLNDTVIYSKLINGTYPNYERVLPKENDKKLQINRELLLATLRRVAIFSSSLTHQVRFIISPKEVTISSEDIEFGAEAKESIPASFTGEKIQVGYNSSYLIDILRHLEDEEIVFDLKDGASAAIIHPIEQRPAETILMLLMPIHINEGAAATTSGSNEM